MDKEYYQDARTRRKHLFLDIMGNKCQLCGYDKNEKALEFHHINPEEKEFSLSDCALKKLDDVYNELRKCILVCANCHRIIHYDAEFKETLITSFNEIKAKEYAEQEEILKLFHSNKKEPKFCPICGKLIHSYRNKYCSKECSYKGYSRQQGTTENRPNREELKNMIRVQSFESIGRSYGVDGNAVRKWCDKYQLPRTKTEINKISNEDWEQL